MSMRQTLQFLEQFERRGWRIGRTRNGHLHLTHPSYPGRKVISPATPSDHRSMYNTRAMIRRIEREGQSNGNR